MNFKVKLGKVKWKNNVVGIPCRRDFSRDVLSQLRRDYRDISDVDGLSGYAIVAWDYSGLSYANYCVGEGSGIVEMQLPGYVRDLLTVRLCR